MTEKVLVAHELERPARRFREHLRPCPNWALGERHPKTPPPRRESPHRSSPLRAELPNTQRNHLFRADWARKADMISRAGLASKVLWPRPGRIGVPLGHYRKQ